MMTYPIKTLNQLPLVLKAFRKEQGLTQAVMAEKLGITQQSYAYFEAKPATVTLERLFTVLRLLNVDISLDRSSPTPAPEIEALPAQTTDSRSATTRTRSTKTTPLAVPSKKKESW
ncbi:helix-turn-helix domain-containing protein [Aromatoleum anaerobium]|nr:helix-turn-helix transcriptional regulator [Aromatoleum anaerobium]MCK0509090.1 helix-turn-helix transcriptional regulator [Aromatoleum anaerobium]